MAKIRREQKEVADLLDRLTQPLGDDPDPDAKKEDEKAREGGDKP